MKKVLATAAALATAASMLAFAPGAQADTVATLEVTVAGTLSITAPLTADLGTLAANLSAQDTAALGQVQVTDNRTGGILTNNWIASVRSSDFTSATTSTNLLASTINYKPGTVAVSGGITSATPAATTAGLALDTPVVTTLATATNTASWSPVLTFVIADTVVAGFYTGTVTHSVV